MAKACSDTVINPISKPSGKTAKKVKVKQVKVKNNIVFSDDFDFDTYFWEICTSHGARQFDREGDNFIICCSTENAYVYPMVIYADFGANIPYFPRIEFADNVIKEIGMENLAKFYFNRKDDYKWSLPF